MCTRFSTVEGIALECPWESIMSHRLFYPQPQFGIPTWFNLSATRMRMLGAVALGWAPLVLLVICLGGRDSILSFLRDPAVHARMLIAVPALLAADTVSEPRLDAIARRLSRGNIICAIDRPRFDKLMDSTNALRGSRTVHVVLVMLTYGLTLSILRTISVRAIPLWHRLPSHGGLELSAAGYWHTLVSLPLLLVLVLSWGFRVLLWGRFLFNVSRMRLELVPAHPDRAAGLMFLSDALRTCAILGFAVGAVVAGGVANDIIIQGHSLLEQKYRIAAAPLFTLVIFTWPLLMFVSVLSRQRRRGLIQYGALAYAFGRRFERKWLERPETDDSMLRAEDFSAANDLYSVAERVYQIRPIPVDPQALAVLLGATLLPFVPVVLATVPVDILLKEISGLLF
jgi:hypothetical protein